MSQPQELIEHALAASSADGCIVIASERTETNLRFAANGLTTNGQMESGSLTAISVVGDDRVGVVTRSVRTADEAADLVRAADAAAQTVAPSEDAAPLVENYPHEDDYGAEPARTGVEVFADFAEQLGTEFGRWQAEDRLLFGFAEHTMTSFFVGTSTGVRRRYDEPDGRLEINGKSADYGRSAWYSQHYPDFAEVDVPAVSAELSRRLQWAAKKVDLAPGRYETLLPPTAVADLMIAAYWAAAARDADEGRSVYANRLGHRFADNLPLTMRSDPSHPEVPATPFQIVRQSFGSMASVFDNAAPIAAVDWLRDGTLVNLIRTRGYAKRTGAEPAPFVDNLIVDAGGTASLDQMVSDTERGLLVTSVWYLREVDPQTLLTTGLTRDGVYLVEHGRVVGAVNNFRFNESPVDLWGRATQAGRSEHTLSREWSDYFSRTVMPALRIPDFNMSTVSQAS
jgi:predicted Zn-dependent protease